MARLREAAVAQFDKEWEEAAAIGVELGRVFRRLAEAMGNMAARGGHIQLVFPDELTQQAWISFREANGDLVPRSPTEPPLPAHADEAHVEA